MKNLLYGLNPQGLGYMGFGGYIVTLKQVEYGVCGDVMMVLGKAIFCLLKRNYKGLKDGGIPIMLSCAVRCGLKEF